MYAFQIPNSKFLIPSAPAGVSRGAGDLPAARRRQPLRARAPAAGGAEAAQRGGQRILAWLDRYQQFFAHDVGRRMAPRALGFITGALDGLTVPFAHRALAADESPERLHDTIVIRKFLPGHASAVKHDRCTGKHARYAA